MVSRFEREGLASTHIESPHAGVPPRYPAVRLTLPELPRRRH